MTEPKTHPALLKAQEVYAKAGDLTPHQQTFLTAVHRITMIAIRTRATAQHDFGYGSKTYLATSYLAANKERDDLTAALELFNASHAAVLEGM